MLGQSAAHAMGSAEFDRRRNRSGDELDFSAETFNKDYPTTDHRLPG